MHVSDAGGGGGSFDGPVTAEAGAEATVIEARDRATQASRLKSDFLANMSHEIRTPMNGVIGMTELLLETALDETQRDYAETIRVSADALMTIINDILDFSKVEAGKVELENLDFSPRAVVDSVLSLLARPAQDKGLKLLAETNADVPPLVRGDPGRVRQVLSNLIGNAIKFTDSGEVMVRVDISSADALDSMRFEVVDTGIGIAPEHFDRIFDPFVQADTSTSRKYGGTGLGLSICRDLANLMGGDCGVTSRLGEGSKFWFTVRVDAPWGPQSLAGQSADELMGVWALIVDDNAARREVLAEHLSEWRMDATTAASGAAPLAHPRAAAATSPLGAVALIDLNVADVDGLDLAQGNHADPALPAEVCLT